LWIFADMTLSVAVPAAATAGVPVTVTVTAQDDRNNEGYDSANHVQNSDASGRLVRWRNGYRDYGRT
jgi:hypothetical protein